jgi:hypothetical protein
LPADLAQLTANIQDLVAREYSWRNARSRGLDHEAQFVEDRRNFLYYQALDFFEKEKLLPQIEITAAETTAYYRSETAEFIQPLRARGRLFHFRELSGAASWLQTREEAAAQSAEDIEVSRQSPIPGAERLVERILRIPDGMPFGPFRTETGPAIFLKQTTQSGPRPYAEVSEAISAKLTRLKLQALELKLAREWALHHVIEDKLDPKEFGVAGPVEKPWRARD